MTRSVAGPEHDRSTLPTGFCRAVTQSSSAHPGDWGRALSLALEYLAVQVAFTEALPEPEILLGRDVRLSFEANGGGVVIIAELDTADRGR